MLKSKVLPTIDIKTIQINIKPSAFDFRSKTTSPNIIRESQSIKFKNKAGLNDDLTHNFVF